MTKLLRKILLFFTPNQFKQELEFEFAVKDALAEYDLLKHIQLDKANQLIDNISVLLAVPKLELIYNPLLPLQTTMYLRERATLHYSDLNLSAILRGMAFHLNFCHEIGSGGYWWAKSVLVAVLKQNKSWLEELNIRKGSAGITQRDTKEK